MKRRVVAAAVGAAAIAAASLVPVSPSVATSVPAAVERAPTFADVSDAPPEKPLPIAFIHHSCGGQLLAAEGPDVGTSCVYASHPSGGGLRAALETQGYRVHEASYDSVVGDKTDLFDWAPKFSGQMDRVLRLQRQDTQLPEGEKNRVVVFKSCFTNNAFTGEGAAPGDAKGTALTVWNARATLASLLPVFGAHPETLFVYVTAPPNAPRPETRRLYRVAIRALKGKIEPAYTARQAAWARELNDWVVSPKGWLAGYAKKNVVVFDYYGVLTGDGRSNLLTYVTDDDADSHPSAAGNRAAAKLFVPFINRAVRRAGIVAGSTPAG